MAVLLLTVSPIEILSQSATAFGMDHMVFMGSGTGIIRRQLKHSTMVNNRKFPAH